MKKKFSLIMATLGRYNEVDKMIESLLKQTYKNFELIIVDQNKKGFLDEIIKKYDKKIEIVYINTEKKGLSRARNIGLKYIKGDYVGFPDDDCIYRDTKTLEKIVTIFENKNLDVLTATIIHNEKKKEGNKFVNINKFNVWIKGISYTMFFKRKVINEVGFFDERLGVGSDTQYGSGEETDYLIRALNKNFILYNTDNILIYHHIENFNNKKIYKKAYSYSKGRMFVLKKHNYSVWFIKINQLYPLFKLFRYIYIPKRIKYYWYQFLGRL